MSNIINLIKAENGDCFLIQFDNKICILIDCGYKCTYDKWLKPLLVKLAHQNYRIGLFIVTHYDCDHIGGAISFIKENGESNAPKIIPIDNIWFNGIFSILMSSELLMNHLIEKVSDDQSQRCKDLVESLKKHICLSGEGPISAQNSECFETLCKRYDYRLNAGSTNGKVLSGTSLQLRNDIVINCLNPSETQIKELEKWINLKCIKKLGAQYELEKSQFIEFLTFMLLADSKELDTAFSSTPIVARTPRIEDWLNRSKQLRPMNTINRSSIVVEISYQDKILLFAGDSESSDWVLGAKDKYDIVKLSHHGTTKPNIELLNHVTFHSAIISTNGRRKHPEKDLLARLIINNVSNIYFNYEIQHVKDLIKMQEFYDFKVFFDTDKIYF